MDAMKTFWTGKFKFNQSTWFNSFDGISNGAVAPFGLNYYTLLESHGWPFFVGEELIVFGSQSRQ
jgi:hypothetical protein